MNKSPFEQKKFYEGDEVTEAFHQLADKENGPMPDQSLPCYAGLGRCWEWRGNRTLYGYACIPIRGKSLAAHRLSYQLHKGEIPKGMHILHACDTKFCTNPEHLRAGTQQENIREYHERKKFIPKSQYVTDDDVLLMLLAEFIKNWGEFYPSMYNPKDEKAFSSYVQLQHRFHIFCECIYAMKHPHYLNIEKEEMDGRKEIIKEMKGWLLQGSKPFACEKMKQIAPFNKRHQ